MNFLSNFYKTMPDKNHSLSLEELIEQWRSYLNNRKDNSLDVEKMEGTLRTQIALLVKSGLTNEEAFLIAVKRISEHDGLSHEFLNKHSDRLWKQSVLESMEQKSKVRTETIVAFCLALAAAVAIKVPVLFGIEFTEEATDQNIIFYFRNLSLFVLPFLTGYFAWKRQLDYRKICWLAGAFIIAATFANVYPFDPESYTGVLSVIHLPIALWFVVGIAYSGSRWREVSGRMDFIRFSGELFIYYVLIALGGGVLTAFTFLIFEAIGIEVISFVQSWLLPCGAMVAVLISSWLVEGKQSVMENIAPILARLFTPLFTAVLITFLAALLLTGRGVNIERNVLIAFDLLLVVVLGLLLYSVSARDPMAPPGVFDAVRVVMIVSALLVDAVALWAIAARITELGFTPNRVAALGENIILLVNLGWSSVLYVRYLWGPSSFELLEKWQTDYLPVYAIWMAIVVIIFPPIFGYI